MSKDTEIKKAICFWCKAECGVLVHVENGRLLKVEPDPDWPRKVWPPNKGCLRRKAALEWFYHPDRLNYPLKRVGERGEGKWQQVTWDEALDDIASKIKKLKAKYGPETLAFISGTGRTENAPIGRFLNLFGTPNIAGQATICFGPRIVLANAIVGMFPNFAVKPMTKCIVLIGVEPLQSRPIVANILLQAKEKGARTIVIDPRRTRTASTADIWLQLRPGTDAALLLGMAHVIIQEGLYDKDFVARWCYGFDKLKARVAEYSPQKAAAICEVPAEKIAAAARLFAGNRPGTFIEGMGVEHLHNVAEVLHARWVLAALAGNIDVEGGEELSGAHPSIVLSSEIELPEKLSPAQRQKQLGADRFKLLTWPGHEILTENIKRVWGRAGGLSSVEAEGHAPSIYRAMLTGQPYPVKAALCLAANPMVTQANIKLVYKALKNLDLLVVMDYWMTPTGDIADYVLPAASWLERPMLWDLGGYAKVLIGGEAALPRTVPGQYDRREDYELWRELGLRLGQKRYWPWKNLTELHDYQLKPMGLTEKEFIKKGRVDFLPSQYKKYEKMGFATPTGKVELYSTVLEKLGYDPLPRHVEPGETRVGNPELAKDYPLTLITGGRYRDLFHSEWRHIDSVRRTRPYPLLQIHPETAQKLGIQEGDWVWIETPRGRMQQKATLFDGLAPDVVHADHGWWLPEMPGEEPWLHGVWQVNINVCTDDDPEVCNPIIGVWPLRTALCKVYKVKTY